MEQYPTRIILVFLALVLLLPVACTAEVTGVGRATGSAGVAVMTALPMSLPVPTPGGETANYTKLEIMPSYLNVMPDPGVVKEMTVTVRNRDTKTAHVRPVVRPQPYSGPYVAESSWIAITPVNADIAPGESAKFTVAVTVPAETLRGSYSSMITFTDEAYPAAYPPPFPGYIHTLNLNINVASSPVIQISPLYINDQLEAGNEYSYTVDVKNKGSTSLSLNAKIGDESSMMYGPYGPQEPPLTAKSFTIRSPPPIAPGRNGTVTITVRVPQNATGYFNGNVDLGIDNPSIRMEEGRVQLSFQIWKQPQGGFSKTFTVTSYEPISVELTSAMPMMRPVTVDGASRNQPRTEPSFDAMLTGPDGRIPLVPVEKVIKGSVGLGTDPYLGGGDQPGQYQDVGSQYVFSYTAQGRPGRWTLAVMPKNTQSFEYKISLGNEKSTPTGSLFVIPTGRSTGTTGQ